MLSTILLQAAAGMGIAKMGATIGAGFAAIGAGIGIGLIGKSRPFNSQIVRANRKRQNSALPESHQIRFPVTFDTQTVSKRRRHTQTEHRIKQIKREYD